MKSVKQYISNKIVLQAVIIFIIAFVTNIVILQQGEGIAIYPDHFGLLAAPAMIAGYDWTDAIALAGYYGPGFFILYSPLLFITDNPLLIYNIIVDIHMAVLALAAVIVYLFLSKVLQPERRIYMAISVIIGIDFVLQTIVVKAFGNEAMIVLISSLFSIFVFKYCNSKLIRVKIYIALVGAILMVYAITVHVRNIIFLPAIAVFFIYKVMRDRRFDKTKFFLFGVMFLLFCIVSIIAYKVVPIFFRNILFETNTSKVMVNQEVHINIGRDLNDLIVTVSYTIYGSLIASVKQTYGIIIVAIYLTCKVIRNIIFKNGFIVNESFEMIFVFSAVCFWIAWFATCLSWRGSPRFTGYWRYYGSYGLIMLVLSAYYFFAYADIKRKIAFLMSVCVLCIIKEFQMVVYPTLDSYLEFWYTYPKFQNSGDASLDYYKTVAVMLLGVFILLFIKKRKALVYTIYFIIVYTIACYRGGNLMSYIANNRCDKGYLVFQMLSDNGDISDGEDVFFIGSDTSYLYYQYMFFDKTIKRLVYDDTFKDYYENELENVGDVLIFSDNQRSDLNFADERWFELTLDDNEYIYSQNQELIERARAFYTDLGF